ncbi:MAG: penicillin-binding protein 2 [Neisseria sp.]|nr:penicillin-binding protein 2 [Neisseria sp.]
MKTQRHYRYLPAPQRNEDKHRFVLRLMVAFALVLVMFAVLTGQLYRLQVVKYRQYVDKARANRISLLPTPPIRGEIVDARGVVLARNYPAFSLEIVPNRLDAPLDETIAALQQYVDITPGDLRRFEKFRADYRGYDNIPLKLKLTADEAGRLSSELYRFPGVEINARTFREYPHGELTAHFVGYIGRISQADMERIDRDNRGALYRGTTHIGKLGLESFYEAQLHGAPGFQEVEKDAQGNIVQVLRTIPPKTGQTLKLSLDLRMQREADRLLGKRRGAVVAINPQNGGVLALVSKPSFDPNLFIDGIDTENWNRLNTDWQRPLINRATQGLYPPGSTFKPFMAMAALESGSIGTGSILPAPGAWSIPGSSHQFRDSVRSGHGAINLSKAIQVSSDTFFYQLGYRMGIDNVATYLEPFGFGAQTGIDLPNEYIGVLPSREWKEKRFAKSTPNVRQWLPADTVSVSIGQGYNIYTPLQMAFATAILAADGQVYRPHLVSELIDHENRQSIIIEPKPSRTVPYKPAYFSYVKQAMGKVLQPGGTAWRIGAGLKYPMAGKTGTAQVVRIKQGASYNAAALAEQHRDHAWFIAFAPTDKPQIAVAVIIENGGWGANAAPIARELADFYLLQLNTAVETVPAAPVAAAVRTAMTVKPTRVQAAFAAVAASSKDNAP